MTFTERGVICVAFIVAVAATGCGGTNEEGRSDEAPACAACEAALRTCGAPGLESVQLAVTAQEPAGCTVVLNDDPPSTIRCEPLEICRGGACTPVEEQDGTLVFASAPGVTVTCVP